MAITCGNKQALGAHSHDTVDEVRACYRAAHPAAAARADAGLPSPSRFQATPAQIAAEEFPDSTKYNYGRAPARLEFPKVPESKYALAALPGHANALTFFEVQTGKKGQWKGFQFVSRLVGHPGDFQKFPVKGPAKAIVLRQIADDPQAAALLFSTEFTVCARCGSPLTDDTSRARGLGPDCVKAFG